MPAEGFFFQAFMYLAAAVISVPIAKRLGLGSVLGYLAAGLLIGPYVLHLVGGEEGEEVLHFAEFGVVMMLFLVGLELEPSRLWRLRAPILGLGGLQVTVTTLLIAGVAMGLGLEWRAAVAVGMVLALSSTAIVLQTLAEKGWMQTGAGRSAFSVLLFQDIAVIPMLALLPLLAVPGTLGGDHDAASAHGSAGSSSWVEGLPGWAQAGVVLAAVAAIVLIGRFLVRPVLRIIAATRLRELLTAASLLLVIGIALLMTRVGLSPALGTFLAGVVLANSEFRHELESDIEPFKGLLLGLFFISVGASLDFRILGEQPAQMAGLVFGLVVVKLLILVLLGSLFKLGFDQRLLFGFALAQGSEFAFVLFSFATQNRVLEESLAGLLIAVVALSMALTPLVILVFEKLIQPRFGTRERSDRPPDEMGEEENPVLIAGFGRFGQVVARFLSANGVESTVLDFDSGQVDLLRRFGYRVFYGDATRHDLLRAAGAERARLLVLALDSPEKTLQLVETAKKHFPHLVLLARAAGRREAYELIEAGIDQVYRETFDSALKMGIGSLEELGFRAYRVRRAAHTFRRLDEQHLRELAGQRADEKSYINLARQRSRDVECVLREDAEDREAYRDAGWDTDSLGREFADRGSGSESA